MQPIGRDAEVAEVVDRVRSGRRLVTIVGPGGIGKTTLANAATAVLAGSGAARFVALANVEDDDAVPGTIAAALGFASFDVVIGNPDLVGAVVVVDNCEHVGEGAAAAVGAMAAACSGLTIIATSRTPLAVAGESLVALAPLPVPASGSADRSSPAVALLCERALDIGVTIADEDLELAGELCRRVDGVPLAVELAAARLRSVSLAELVGRLGVGIDVLHRPRHHGASRHRSVRDTITWSIDLLEPGDRARLARVAVCPGPFALDAVATLLDEPEPIAASFLERVIDASLVEVDRRTDPTQYRILEPIRQVAIGLLDGPDDLAATRERLTRATFEWLVEALDRATRCWWPTLLDELMAGFDRTAASIRHCVEHDPDPTRAHVFCVGLWGAVHQARVDDVLTLSEAVLDRWPLTDPGTGADAAAANLMARLLHGELEEAELGAHAALALSAGSWGASVGLRRILGLAARYRGDHVRALALLDEAVAAAAELGSDTFEWECRVYAAQDRIALGDVDTALRVVREVAAAAAARGSVINEIWANTVRATALMTADATRDEAASLAAATLAISERVGYPFGVSCNLQTIAMARLADGDLAGAAATASRLLAVFGRSGPGDLRRALEIGASVLVAAGHPQAGRIASFARGLPDTNPMIVRLTLPAHDGDPIVDRAIALTTLRAALGELDEPAAQVPATVGTAAFVHAGGVWDLSFRGRAVRIAGSKGMDDLATLLATPDHDVHCLDLIGGAVEQPDTGTVIDATARRQYEARIRELQADLDEAEAANDIGRAARAGAELDALVDHLAAALALGGRTRSAGSNSERARSAVTHRIRKAIDRIAAADPDLGRHLRASVRTGHYCSYRPDAVVAWDVRRAS